MVTGDLQGDYHERGEIAKEYFLHVSKDDYPGVHVQVDHLARQHEAYVLEVDPATPLARSYAFARFAPATSFYPCLVVPQLLV